MQVLAKSLQSRPEEELPVLEANLALSRRNWPHDEKGIRTAQTNIAACFSDLGREDEALVLKRAIYAKEVTSLGTSHQDTLRDGCNVANSLIKLHLWDETTTLLRDQLLPPARRSLGPDHDTTLELNLKLAAVLGLNPACTSDNLRQHRFARCRHNPH
mmetsp:Transcript_28608/g.88505  ORF Transcript_28608/g.88505 Transcript_28608/m.88505 type:complete len:158 (-) Transcript_28608:197-670(-)